MASPFSFEVKRSERSHHIACFLHQKLVVQLYHELDAKNELRSVRVISVGERLLQVEDETRRRVLLGLSWQLCRFLTSEQRTAYQHMLFAALRCAITSVNVFGPIDAAG